MMSCNFECVPAGPCPAQAVEESTAIHDNQGAGAWEGASAEERRWQQQQQRCGAAVGSPNGQCLHFCCQMGYAAGEGAWAQITEMRAIWSRSSLDYCSSRWWRPKRTQFLEFRLLPITWDQIGIYWLPPRWRGPLASPVIYPHNFLKQLTNIEEELTVQTHLTCKSYQREKDKILGGQFNCKQEPHSVECQKVYDLQPPA